MIALRHSRGGDVLVCMYMKGLPTRYGHLQRRRWLSFPKGGRQLGDTGPRATAAREWEEETGLPKAALQYLKDGRHIVASENGQLCIVFSVWFYMFGRF